MGDFTKMNDVIFREYDIRGKVDVDFTIEETYRLTQAIVSYVYDRNKNVKSFAVGMDGRTHSPAIKKMVTQAIIDSGFDVIFIGMCPSPALYFAMHTLSVDAGIMITASHNPKEYNGLKLCLGTESIWGSQIKEILSLYKRESFIASDHKGNEGEYLIIPLYIQYLISSFEHLKGIPLSAVIDCGNASGGTVIPQLVNAMDWEHVQVLYAEIDGTYPNHEPDPTDEANMRDVKKILATTDTQVGIGLDGDCDRMTPMTKSGTLVSGDVLLALFAKPIIEKYKNPTIVLDIKSSDGVFQILKEWGANPIFSPSGHSIIKNEMKKHNAVLAGELSCHFFFKDRYFGYDDGIYAIMRLFELLHTSQKRLDALVAEIPTAYATPEFRIACNENMKQKTIDAIKEWYTDHDDATLITIDGIRVTTPYGWGLIRASNTQPVVSLRFESTTKEGLAQILREFCNVLSTYIDTTVLTSYKEK